MTGGRGIGEDAEGSSPGVGKSAANGWLTPKMFGRYCNVKEDNTTSQFEPTSLKTDPLDALQKETPVRRTAPFVSGPSHSNLPDPGMWMRYSNSSDYQPPAFNGSYPPPGEEIPTDYTSFFNFGDTPPPSPSKVKNFFGSLRNRARSNPDNDGEFKMRQRSRTNPFEDKNKLKVIVDSWGASSKSKAIEDSLITKAIPPVPKLPEVLKPSRTRLRPLAPIDIEGRHTVRGVEPGIAENNVLQSRPLGESSPIRAERVKPQMSLSSLQSPPPSRHAGLVDTTNSPRSPLYAAVIPPVAPPVRQVTPTTSVHMSKEGSSSPTRRFYGGLVLNGPATLRGELPKPSQQSSSLDRAHSSHSNTSSECFSVRTPSTTSSSVNPFLRTSSGNSMLDVYRPQLEPLTPISPFGVSFPGSTEAASCGLRGTGHVAPPEWTPSTVDSVHSKGERTTEKWTGNDASDSPDLQRPEEGELASDLSMWWGSEGAYYYDTRAA